MDHALFDIRRNAFVDDDLNSVVFAGDESFSGRDGTRFAIFIKCPARRARADRAGANVAASAVVAVKATGVDATGDRQKHFYRVKEMIHELYRVRGYKRAKRYLTKLTDFIASLKLDGLKSLRRTLMSWREEILNYFKRRLTNGKTEGFNRKAKLIQRAAYGFKKFENYRLKLIYLSK